MKKDLEFDIAIGKLVNAIFLEVTIALENIQSLDQFLLPAFELLDGIFPVMLQFLSREEEEFHDVLLFRVHDVGHRQT